MRSVKSGLKTCIEKRLLKCFILLTLSSSPLVSIADNENAAKDSLYKKIEMQQQEIDNLKLKLDELFNAPTDEPAPELSIAGFFDVNVHTTDESEHPFDLGSLEVDLQYDQIANVAISTALVWDGDAAEVAVAVLDYHAYGHNVPARGQIFGEPGFHVQFGRFDIPFGIDYNFFAAPDRPNVTAPLTTQRIQNDGFNGDGLRAYGSWSQLDYALYWTNSLFEDEGTSIGGRIGYFPGRNPYRVHHKYQERNFVVGFSYLRDMDSKENARNTLNAFDLTWRMGIAEITFESIQLNNVNDVLLVNGLSVTPADESGNNIAVLLDFDPVGIFVGYGEWKPDYSAVVDPEDPTTTYKVAKLKRITLGARYVLGDYLQIKLEYLTHMDTKTEEPDFEKRRLTFQMVASF